MKRNLFTLSVLGAFTVFVAASCSKNNSETPNDGTNTMAKVQFVLTDAPASYDAVNIDLKELKFNDSTGDAGWTSYPVNAKLYDLLQYSNGKSVTLGNPLPVPAGKIEQIRLVLGSNNSVVVNGVTHALETPSAQQSGLKINFHKELLADGVYKIWLDFDAARSIVRTGNGKYILKPVIRAFSEETNGQITGKVLPDSARATVYLLKGTDTLSSAIPAPGGTFKFVGIDDKLSPFSINFHADTATHFKDATLTNVNVVFGRVTDVGTTTLVK
jgi:hypothetical protein